MIPSFLYMLQYYMAKLTRRIKYNRNDTASNYGKKCADRALQALFDR
jgi:hypothetical protein